MPNSIASAALRSEYTERICKSYKCLHSSHIPSNPNRDAVACDSSSGALCVPSPLLMVSSRASEPELVLVPVIESLPVLALGPLLPVARFLPRALPSPWSICHGHGQGLSPAKMTRAEPWCDSSMRRELECRAMEALHRGVEMGDIAVSCAAAWPPRSKINRMARPCLA